MQLGDWTFRAFTDGDFRLDGGAMFGVVPRVMWAKHHEPDELNRIAMTLRCLLVEHGDRRILVDTGIGDRWEEKHKGIFAMQRGQGHLVGEMAAAGVSADAVTDVVLTHLHFDHCGGTIREVDGKLEPLFPNARHWLQEQHWRWAHQPTERDRASFRPDDFHPLEDAGLLELVDGPSEIIPGVRVMPVNGHTSGQQLVEFNTGQGVVVYCADLIPLASQVRVPWIMGYDLNPLLTLDEKRNFLSRAVEENYLLFFEHDVDIECCRVIFEDGKFKAVGPFTLAEQTTAANAEGD
ncbi:MBL fold metallo-hydrolase [bacterium]|nr:MBL fold metallo-hydrolase [bacterium]